ncbi:polysaccharide biosynthesis/export family protein [Achromobacter aloeverae]
MTLFRFSPWPARAALALAAVLSLQGCQLPRSGPYEGEISDAAQRDDILLVPVTPQVAAATRSAARATFPPAFGQAAPLNYEALAAGDGVDIIIWENDGLGMFPASPNGASDLGEQRVDRAGWIHIPYIGKVRAAGRTPAEVRDEIMQKLRGVIVSSDVAVRPTQRRGRLVTAQGDLAKPGAYPIDQGTERLSGLLGAAAPNQQNPEQLAITVRRGGLSGTVRLSDIYNDPHQDIALRPGDVVTAHAVSSYLTVLGAAGAQNRLPLTRRNYSVMDALGDARGLNDGLAQPRAVYLLRQAAAGGAPDAPGRPTVYQFDFTRPEQIADAGMFSVQDGDAIYISDAPFTRVQKVLSVFGNTAVGVTNAASR